MRIRLFKKLTFASRSDTAISVVAVMIASFAALAVIPDAWGQTGAETADTFDDSAAFNDGGPKDEYAQLRSLIGKAAPMLPVEGWVGKSRRPKQRRCLLYFWASWAGGVAPDRQIRQLNELHASGLTVVGIHFPDASMPEIKRSVEHLGIKFPVVRGQKPERDGNQHITVSGYPVAVLPCSVFIDADGVIRAAGAPQDIIAYARDHDNRHVLNSIQSGNRLTADETTDENTEVDSVAETVSRQSESLVEIDFDRTK